MIDIAKIADLVLLLIDGNFGFEMETMEFLNIAQHHGMPRVLGITTHLDLFKKQATLRASKKRLKQRFWTEVYQGAKLFYLSGVINGRYPDREMLNLTRFLSVMKFRPLKWRNEHPYLLSDRVIDLTHPSLIEKNPKIDRKIAIYGFLHGTPLQYQNQRVHIAGMGDYTVSNVEKLPDPCPTPYFEQKQEEFEREQAKLAEETGQPLNTIPKRRKRLEDKQKIIYAPMSDVHGVLIDKDAVYIDVGTESFKDGEENGIGEKMVTNLQKASELMDSRLKNSSGVRLFSGGPELHSVEQEDEEEEDSEHEEELLKGESGRKHLRNAKIHTSQIEEQIDMNDESGSEDDEDNYDFDDEEADDKERSRSSRQRFEELNSNEDNNNTKETLQFESDSEFELSDDDDDNNSTKWQKMGSKLNNIDIKRTWNINKLIYMNNIDPADAIARWRKEEELEQQDISESDEEDIEKDDDDDDEFFAKKSNGSSGDSLDLDSSKQKFDSVDVLQSKWQPNSESIKNLQKRFFLSPKQRLQAEKASSEVDDEGDALYGDFEDLENEDEDNESESEKVESEEEEEEEDDFTNFDKEEMKAEMGIESEEEEEGDSDDEEDVVDEGQLTIEEQRELNAKKKEKLRQQFEEEEGEFGKDDDPFNEHDTWYEFQKSKMAKQLEINKSELQTMDEESRYKIEGYKAGSYVKLTFDNLPMEFIENFDPKFPIVIGGLLQTEERFGFLNVRIRRHRWHKKILKTNDPLILSLGWRRFQTMPMYTTSDSRTRNRLLKYTPEHAYCFATFYGPLVAPNTTFCGVQVVSKENTTGSFRIAATGIVEDLNADVEIVKKLKLVGYPYKIFRNTAFIKDMFSSALEVAKFEGASIKTVSGIRGEIKRALSKPEGHFRATFEDKILLSDIVFMRTWYPITPKKFYNPVTSLLLKDKENWKGMRLTGAVRAANNISTPLDPNSTYNKIERQERKFNALKVPKSIKANLPFKSQIHQMTKQKKQSYLQKRAVVIGGEEKKARSLIQTIQTIKKDKDEKKKVKKMDKNKERLKKLAKIEESKKDKEKERKKEYFMKEGKKRSLGGSSDSSEAFGKKRRT
ncbi:hypothetical protein CANARDRAFT_29092 [[Candida] arabinofermentans NRRL YB-2248]|uniref:Uncharacterized protein n=1 Tax=[Candida] arabinofermentans NRRL YB-2248 TaxID=983967 RepID=A0A1E4SYL8_9ASCO|nr:hypothetical protein CANARDRAFT_29092 [[Candida] arabinofermentans NRRL YB-2248]